PGRGQRAGGSLRAADELRRVHPVTVGEDVDVAGLERIELVAARGLEGLRDLGRSGAHTAAPRRRRSPSAVIMSPASTAAMRSEVTFCSPDQAGMLLTSSTLGLPSAACTMSTPAKSAPTAAAARSARPFMAASATAATGRPPCFTLVIQVGA